jgi:hypothetical protein
MPQAWSGPFTGDDDFVEHIGRAIGRLAPD